MTGTRNGGESLYRTDVDGLSAGDGVGGFRAALRSTQMATNLGESGDVEGGQSPETSQALAAPVDLGKTGDSGGVENLVVDNVSGFWLSGEGDGGAGFAGRSAMAAEVPVEIDISALGKLLYGLSEIFVESQVSVAGLEGSDRHAGLLDFTSENLGAHISNGMVAIDAVANNGDGAALLAQLQGLGLELGASFGAMAGGMIPVDALDELASLDLLAFARPVYTMSNVGLVTGQPVQSMNVDTAVSSYAGNGVNATLNGAGLTVGVISDSFNTRTTATTHYAQDVTNGDLPAGVNILLDSPSPGTDEGRAMAQAIYDIAPGVSMAFYTAFVSEASFAAGIVKLSQSVASGGGGAKIIVDDVAYYDEPMFQDGIVAQAVGQATANGAMYFSSAGNQAAQSWEGTFIDSGSTITIGGAAGGVYHLLDFDPGAGVDFRQQLANASGTKTWVLNWDQASLSAGGSGATSDLALIFFNAAGTAVAAANVANIGFDAIEIAQSGTNYASIGIGLKDGSAAPGLIKWIGYGSRPNEYQTYSGTATGHTNADSAISVGASDWVDSSRFGNFPLTGVPFPYAETFSSKGGVDILFDGSGNRLASPSVRTTVDITASDGGNNSFFGSDVNYDADTFPNFYGTSQAAPNAAAVAALLMQKFPGATRAQIELALKQSALDIVSDYGGNTTTAGIGVGPDATTGTGLIQANVAVLKLAAITNHAPVIGVEDLAGAVTELTTAPVGNLTDSGVINFTDADGVWTHIVSPTGTPVGSVLGSLTASVTQDTAADGSGGKVTWNYSVSAASVEYLAAGQTKTDTFTIVLDDQFGATVTKTIVVTITGTGDAPDISAVTTDSTLAALTETNAALAAGGTLTVVDTDVTDNVTPSVWSVTASGTIAGLVPGNAALKAMMSVSPPSIGADPGATHNLSWSFNSGSEAFNYLDEGEVLTLTYTIRGTDNGGLFDDQLVTVTVTGTNDGPTIGLVSPNDRASLTLTDGAAPLFGSGTLTVVDPDMSDGVTASVVSLVSTPTFSAGFTMLTVPLGIVPADPLGNPANLGWQFSAGASTFDYLAAGEHQDLTYTVRVTDDSGATADKSVLVTVIGINEAPIIAGSVPPATAVVEIEDGLAGENVANRSGSGVLAFTDTDVSDTHSASVTANGAGYLGSFTLAAVNQGADNVGWTFTVADSLLNSLGGGVVLHQFYTITISDGHGGTASRVIGVDLVGTNDAAHLSSANVVVTQGLAPATASGALTISDEDNAAQFQPLGNVHGSYGSLSLSAAGAWSYVADSAFTNLAPGQSLTDLFTVHAVDGTPTTISVSIAGSNDIAIAQSDAFVTDEAHAIGSGLSLFADNGSGADADPDGPPLAVAAVNGDPAFVGQQIQLASGALLKVNANGTFTYNPNHAFDYLTQNFGAADQLVYDSFTYALVGGTSATAIVRVDGITGAGDQLRGNGLDNVIDGTAGNDNYRLGQGGSDTANGMGGNDGFYFGAALDHGDKVDGGPGSDSLAVQGNTNVVLGDVKGIEVLVALSGSDASFGDTANNRYDYDITTNDGNVAAGQTLTVIGTGLLPGEDLHFDGSAEMDGNFRIFAGQGNDVLKGGAGNDGFFFGADGNLTGADRVDGGGGIDTLALRGNYTGGAAVVMQNATMTNVEVMAFLTGHANPIGGPIAPGGYDYDVTMADGNVAAGQQLSVSATGLASDESLRFDGRAETNGSFRILSGAGNDMLWGGSGNDTLYGGMGADKLEGGAGADTYVYLSAAESTSTGYDTITGFDWNVDRIDAPGGTRALSGAALGPLSTATFDADLAAGLGSTLGAGQAALFTVTSGTLAGHIFAVIDANGVAGYQAGQDLVIELIAPVLPIDPHAGVIL